MKSVMQKAFLLFTFVVVAPIAMGQTLVHQRTAVWNQGANSFCNANKVAVAPDQSVYVTGTTRLAGKENDGVLIKYDSRGNQLWSRLHQSPGALIDEFADLAFDQSSNVYWIGHNYRKTVIDKYSPAGSLLWSKELGFGVGPSTYPARILVGSDGNPVACYRADSGMHVTKLDSQGNQLWDSFYDGPTHRGANPSDAAMDVHGNGYQTGIISLDGIGQATGTVKISPDGQREWLNLDTGFHSQANYFPFLTASTNSCVVASVPESPFGVGVTYTYQMNAVGGQSWRKLFPDGATQDARARAIRLDSKGNFLVALNSTVPGGVFVVKYDQSGNRLWSSQFNSGSNSVAGLTVDPFGNAITVGSTGGNPRRVEILAYSPSGGLLGSDTISAGGNASAFGISITTGKRGIIYVASTVNSGVALTLYAPIGAHGSLDMQVGHAGLQ